MKCVLLVLITALLVIGSIKNRDKKCLESTNSNFGVIGGKHYPCYSNIKGEK